MKKRHLSLSAQILTLGIALVVLVSLAISIIFMVNINSLTEKNIKKQAEISQGLRRSTFPRGKRCLGKKKGL